MEENKPKTCFVVIEECRTKNCDDTNDCISVHLSKEGAYAKIEECKEHIKKDWKDVIDFDDDWEEEDNYDCYELCRASDYEYYYSVRVKEMTLNS